jgi:hypothetical protein
MKKFLLFFGLSVSLTTGFSQTVLNEIYTEPGAGKSEFFELYNSSAEGKQSVNCFTIVIYWKTSDAVRGWYVLNLPADSVDAKGFYVGAAASPFNVQSKTGVVANFNWNATSFRDGSTGGYLKQYQWDGSTGYTDITASIPTNLNDLFSDVSVGGGHNYIQLVYVDGQFSNGFWGGGASATLPAEITSLPDLDVPADNTGDCAGFTADFGSSDISMEFVNQSPGSDNGFARKFDGKCGAWDKTSASLNHTPGTPNGSAAGQSGELITTEFINCNIGPGISSVSFSITGVTGNATEADDFPIEIRLYQNKGDLTKFDGPDTYIRSKFDATIAEPSDTFTIPQTMRVVLVYKTKRGCFDKVVILNNGCLPLPVSFKSFTATRNNRTNVFVKWETATEQNADGFAVERNINGSWEQIAYVPSQAQGGNSNSLLTYQINDLNAAKGISQYRIRQVDLDGLAKMSDIRSVRGEGQKGSTIVYPNPSDDGKVNVVFEGGAIAKRNITVQDMSGRIIKEWKNYTNNNIQIENLTPGFYTIRIVNIETGEQDVQKAVVNKR